MNKQNLINRAERWEEQSRKMPLMDYPRDGQEEMMKISSAIIKALCEMENITPYKAIQALKIAEDIIEAESKHEVIS